MDSGRPVPPWSSWASGGQGPDVAAPGVAVPVLILGEDGGAGPQNGTSIAAAITGGCLALRYAVDGALKQSGAEAIRRIRTLLARTSTRVSASSARAGAGLVNAAALVRVSTGTPQPLHHEDRPEGLRRLVLVPA